MTNHNKQPQSNRVPLAFGPSHRPSKHIVIRLLTYGVRLAALVKGLHGNQPISQKESAALLDDASSVVTTRIRTTQ